MCVLFIFCFCLFVGFLSLLLLLSSVFFLFFGKTSLSAGKTLGRPGDENVGCQLFRVHVCTYRLCLVWIMDRWLDVLVVFAFIFTVSNGEQEKVTIEVEYKPPEEKCQRKSKDGDQLAMHYTGRLEKDGSVFDSSHNRGHTFDFTMGRGMVIQGWEQGLKDMCVGEKRKLRVPAHLGKVSCV